MACINMFNPDSQQYQCHRISFSNDFVVDPAPPLPPRPARPTDPSFEFSSAGTRPMMAADELFFKGRMLPLRAGEGPAGPAGAGATTTLRDELLANDDDGDVFHSWDSPRPPKAGGSSSSSIRWKEFLGLKKGAGRKGEREVVDAGTGKTLQELCLDGGAARATKDLDMGL